MKLSRPPIEEIRSKLSYNETSGRITWAVDVGSHGRIKAGHDAGAISKSDGYRYVRLMCPDGKRRGFAVHRLAYAIKNGEWPSEEIDHLNGVRADNRWANLRHASRRLNAENMRRPRVDSSTQVKGVNLLPSGRYRAQLRVAGKGIHLGVFQTAGEAHAAYVQAKREQHRGCTL